MRPKQSTQFTAARQDRANLAHAFNKPVVMEEYGCCKQGDYVGKRGQLFQAMHAAVDRLDIAGCMVWQVGRGPGGTKY